LNSREFFARLLDNWPIKVLSIAAAILLFLFHRMGMLEERFFSVPLEVQVNEQLIPAETYPQTVRVTLRGRSEEINTRILPSTPPKAPTPRRFRSARAAASAVSSRLSCGWSRKSSASNWNAS
jgi:hypothetical protein